MHNDSPDYKELLYKYMELIIAEEGISYIERANDPFNRNSLRFNQEELEDLKAIESYINTKI